MSIDASAMFQKYNALAWMTLTNYGCAAIINHSTPSLIIVCES